MLTTKHRTHTHTPNWNVWLIRIMNSCLINDQCIYQIYYRFDDWWLFSNKQKMIWAMIISMNTIKILWEKKDSKFLQIDKKKISNYSSCSYNFLHTHTHTADVVDSMLCTTKKNLCLRIKWLIDPIKIQLFLSVCVCFWLNIAPHYFLCVCVCACDIRK